MKVMWYFEDKKERAKKAKEHTAKMEALYYQDIENCVEKTQIYDGYNNPFEVKEANTYKKEVTIQVIDQDSVSAVLDVCNGSDKIVVLNFASYKHPGGMFDKGSSAQEESLCHESFLYNVLKHFDESYYEWNREHLNKGLYLNRALYSPDVVFVRDEKSVLCDVITCAAPNKAVAKKYQRVTDKENFDVLSQRITFILDIAKKNKVDVLVLGAFGAGVFGQEPNEVAKIFKKLLKSKEYCYAFARVVFAVPKGKTNKFNDNYDSFVKILGNIF